LDRKTFTFIIVSDRKGITRRLVVPAAWVKLAAFLSVILVVVAAGVFVDYSGLLFQAVENKKLKAENLELKDQFRVVEGKLESLVTSVERVKTFATKLRLITDTEGENRTLKLAVGPLARPQSVEQYAEPIDQRNPANIAREESVFFEKKPTQFKKGRVELDSARDYALLAVRIDRAIKETSLREQSVLELWEALSTRKSLLRATPSVKPVRGWYTSPFGYRLSPLTGRLTLHQGVDIAASPGTPVYASGDGKVSFSGYESGYGKLVSIDHGYGVVTRYGHNSQLFVVVGQTVSRGDVIAAVGSTGSSTGPHVHYEVRINNVPVDPMNYILDQ
jgi:murein DD-endopeptidase MepM/ murein hydrolase activator NlpD